MVLEVVIGMATFTYFLALPSEIQILILRHYLPKWEFDIEVSQSPKIPANFRIGTGCPFNFIFRAAGRQDDFCALWTSKDLYEPARMALEQGFTGTLHLFTPGNWHYPQRKPMFDAFVLPRLPAQMIKRITLEVGRLAATTLRPPRRPSPKDYLTWRDLTDFVDFRKMPNLECVRIYVSLLGNFDFRIDQIGDVLRGRHDEMIMESLRQLLPRVHPGQRRQMKTPSDADLKVEVIMIDDLESWVPTWKTYLPAVTEATMCFDLTGKNTEELQVMSRTVRSLHNREAPYEYHRADGATWEFVAAKLWPELNLAAAQG